ncbi:hypothetical protein OWV82_015473 [Melia azedarach]|uniref:Uncharacterized protein n=1 Tax=Melia azedarach TaxID=155640 RepID=A0ACC1XPT8_MELAZ|nr:hypothetical protein OWV82_015473 [Melia azedarach]
MESNHPEIDIPTVYEPNKPEISTKYGIQSSECKFAAKQENVATSRIDHEISAAIDRKENQQKHGQSQPDHQRAAKSQIQSQQSQTPSEAEAKDKQQQPTEQLPVPPLRNMTTPDKWKSIEYWFCSRFEDCFGLVGSSMDFEKGSKRVETLSDYLQVSKTPPSASANPKNGKTASLLGRFKKCFS